MSSAGPPSFTLNKTKGHAVVPQDLPEKQSLAFPPTSSSATLLSSLFGRAQAIFQRLAREWRLGAGSKLKGHSGETMVTAFLFSCAVKIKVEMGYTITDI